MRRTRQLLSVAAGVVGLATAWSARADSLNWLGDDFTAGGPGTWNEDAANPAWANTTTSVSPVPWTPGNTATFAGTADVVTVGTPSPTGIAGITFSTAGYTLSGGSLGLITTAGSAGTPVSVPLSAAVNATIGSVIAGGNGTLFDITKSGAGTLTLSGNNTFTVRNNTGGSGGVIVTGGTLLLTGNNSGVAGQFSLSANGATIAVGTDTAMGTNNRLRFQTATGTLRSADTSTRTLGNFLDVATNGTNFGSSTTGNLVFTGTVAVGGGAKTLTINNTITTIAGDLTGTGGAAGVVFSKTGPGTLVISGATAYDRPFTITAGTVQVTGSGRLGSATGAATTTVGDNGLLDLQVAGLSNAGTLAITSSDTTPEVNIGTGVNDTVKTLFINGVAFDPGTYGSTASGASNTGLANPNDIFSGDGRLTVLSIPEPAAATLIAAGALGLLARRRRSARPA